MSAKPIDDIPASIATNAYHVAKAKADAAGVEVSSHHRDRARELMALAVAPGITSSESVMLIAAKLTTWDQDYEDVLEDKRRLAREIDVEMFGEAGAAKQPSLCGVLASVRVLVAQNAELRRLLAEAVPLVEEARVVAARVVQEGAP